MASSTGTSLTSFWLNFFTTAGIPAGEATNYAISFADNRITEDMLMDLNKEILQDVGVKVMGDIIAILKHAKNAHNQSAREKLLKGASSTPVRVATPPRRSTPASRTVNHYLGTDPEARPMKEAAPKTSISQQMANRLGPSPSQSDRSGLGTPSSSDLSFDSEHQEDSLDGLHESPSATCSNLKLKQTNRETDELTHLHRPNITAVKLPTGRQQREEVPVPKVRRVFPEHEGKYKITMPAGTTAKTRKILEDQGLATSAKKSSVFQRLGGEGSSQTASPKVTITGLGNIVVNKTAESQPSGIFTRLGQQRGIKRAAATSTTDDGSDEVRAPGALEYAGIFKFDRTPPKKARVQAPTATVNSQKLSIERRLGPARTADSTSSAGIFSNEPDMPTKISITARTGAATKPVLKQSVPIKVKVPNQNFIKQPAKQNIKARLGPQKAEVTSSTQGQVSAKNTVSLNRKGGVFSRLGKQV